MAIVFDVLATMTDEELERARMRLAIMSLSEADLAIKYIDSELLRRDVSRYPREIYVKSKLANLPKTDPMVGSMKGDCMNKTIWYGAKDNAVRFAESSSALTEVGINNPQSFTAENVTGLNLIGSTEQVHAQHQTTAKA